MGSKLFIVFFAVFSVMTSKTELVRNAARQNYEEIMAIYKYCSRLPNCGIVFGRNENALARLCLCMQIKHEVS